MPCGADSIQGEICVVRCIQEEGGKAWIQMSKQTHKNPLSKREVEFLKKLQAANMEVQRQWESRHRQK